jgi:hypothetical protein
MATITNNSALFNGFCIDIHHGLQGETGGALKELEAKRVIKLTPGIEKALVLEQGMDTLSKMVCVPRCGDQRSVAPCDSGKLVTGGGFKHSGNANHIMEISGPAGSFGAKGSLRVETHKVRKPMPMPKVGSRVIN